MSQLSSLLVNIDASSLTPATIDVIAKDFVPKTFTLLEHVRFIETEIQKHNLNK